ncbi:MAG: UDP-glucose/GDP-mannose dehydrogenase family protein [Dehalococcoidales bacterium]|nr:UDP-glucose/GDP-mannose dehydrogenase family protein [Dehalococcoidales bacterium]
MTTGIKDKKLPVGIDGKAMNLSVVGSGYIGLVTGIGLAMSGHQVTCIDCDSTVVTKINHAIYPFYEPSLDGLLEKCVNKNCNLKAVEEYSEIANCDASFICVGTFSKSENNTDFSNIADAAAQIGHALRDTNAYHLVVVKSTVPPGTTEEVIIPILEKQSSKKAGRDFGVAVNPEFIQEGNASRSSLNPDRVIIGEHDQKAGDILQSLYESSYSGPIIRTSIRTAEMIKYASNAFLATKITFINEIGNLCKKLGIDVYDVAQGMGYDPRIGQRFLNAGIGFGGSCLPKDLEELICRAQQTGYDSRLLSAVLNINAAQPLILTQIAEERLGGLKDKVVTVLGLAFKAGTDDMRDAPSLKVIAQLMSQGALVKTYDPKAMPRAKTIVGDGVEFCASAQEAIDGTDCVLIVTDWEQFKDEELYRGKLVIDGRRALDPDTANHVCAHYEGVCW